MKKISPLLFFIPLIFFSCARHPQHVSFPLSEKESGAPVPVPCGKANIRNGAPVPVNLDTFAKPSFVKLKTPLINPDGNANYSRSSSSSVFTFGAMKVEDAKPTKIPAHPKFVIAGKPKVFPLPSPAMKENAMFSIKYFSADQHLPGTVGQCLLEDHLGRMWIGTDNGLAMIDGANMNVFTTEQGLSVNTILCLMEDEKGRIWIGTDGGGINVYDGFSFTKYSEAEGLCSPYIRSLIKDSKGRTWIGTDGCGVDVLDNGNFFHYDQSSGLSDKVAWSILEDNAGNILVGTKTGGVNIFDPHCKTISHLTQNEGLGDNSALYMMKDHTGKIWIGSGGGGVSVFNPQLHTITRYSTNNGLSGSSIIGMGEDHLHRVWIGTYYNGVNLFDTSGKPGFYHYTTKQGMSNDEVLCIHEDRSGHVWMGTNGGGVDVFDGIPMIHYSKAMGMTYDYTYALCEDYEGKTWIGTYGGGVDVYDGQNFFCMGTNAGLASNYVRALQEDDGGNMWIGHYGFGLDIYEPTGKNGAGFLHYDEKSGLAQNYVWAMMKDSKNRVWVGTARNGIDIFEDDGKGGKKISRLTTAEGLNNNSILSLLQDKNGKVWIGTDGGGVNVYDPQSGTITAYTTKEGLSNNSVMGLFEDKKGKIWIATDGGGINIFDGKTFTHYSTAQGLADNSVSQLQQDASGNVWAGTGNGLTCFSENPDGSFQLVNWGKAHGMKRTDFNAPGRTMVISSHNYSCRANTLWGGVGSLLLRFEIPLPDTSRPEIFLTAVDLSEKNTDWRKMNAHFSVTLNAADTLWHSATDTLFATIATLGNDTGWLFNAGTEWNSTDSFFPYYLPRQLSVPYGENHLTFHFGALKFGDWGDVRYRCMLDGLDATWNDFTAETKADYRNIPPGDYIFRVRAEGRNGKWSDEADFSFTVRPPWWQTGWAYAGYVALFFSSVFGFSGARTRTLRRRKRELEQTVADRTSEIRLQKEKIEEQKHLVDEKNKEVLDSIHYASRIQRALLTSEKYISSHLGAEYFILYRPKDIVSGDFYWALEHSGKFFLATCDCTGHGVPGAFMSMLNISYLNEALIEHDLLHPNEILDEVRKNVIHALNPEGVESESKDGMDCVLCCIDIKTLQLEFAAANNPLWLCRGGTITEYAPDKMPVGKHEGNEKPFSLKTIALQKGDIVYTFTDGFADQFGGPQGKKFKYKQLKETLLALSASQFDQQKKSLEEIFERWRGNLEQVDDVLVVGIRM